MPRKGLNLRVDGEIVHKVEDRVEGVQILSARGEIARVGIAEADEVLDIVIMKAGTLNRNLQDVDAENRDKRRKELKDAPEEGRTGHLKFNVGQKPDEDVDLTTDPNASDDSSSKDSTKKSSGSSDSSSGKKSDK